MEPMTVRSQWGRGFADLKSGTCEHRFWVLPHTKLHTPKEDRMASDESSPRRWTLEGGIRQSAFGSWRDTLVSGPQLDLRELIEVMPVSEYETAMHLKDALDELQAEGELADRRAAAPATSLSPVALKSGSGQREGGIYETLCRCTTPSWELYRYRDDPGWWLCLLCDGHVQRLDAADLRADLWVKEQAASEDDDLTSERDVAADG